MKIAYASAAVLLSFVLVGSAFAQTPPAGGGRMELKITKADRDRLAKCERDYILAKSKLAKAPKDKKAQQHFSECGTVYGHESMVSPVLPAKVKYKQALRIYREVLKVDPRNPVARTESELIITIYKQMHLPIPKD